MKTDLSLCLWVCWDDFFGGIKELGATVRNDTDNEKGKSL